MQLPWCSELGEAKKLTGMKEKKEPEYSPLISPPRGDEGEIVKVSP